MGCSSVTPETHRGLLLLPGNHWGLPTPNTNPMLLLKSLFSHHLFPMITESGL